MIFLVLLSACQPPRSPLVKRPLEIEGKAEPTVQVPLSAPTDLVRIGIRVEVSEVAVECLGVIKATDLSLNRDETWPPGRHVFSSKNGQLILDGSPKGKKWRLNPEQESQFLKSGEKEYRGAFVVRATQDDKVSVVNELSIDDYLKGVLPREVIVTWDPHALQAQAVASRTYMASHLGAHAAQGFDLCSDVHCQVYGGMSKEHPKTNEAVDSTRDQILVYAGKPIGAFFHSHCGGSTEQIQPVWGSDNKPYLPRKKCTYCKGNPRYQWTLSMSGAEILSALKSKTNVTGNQLESLKIKKKSGSGRVQTITVSTNKGHFDLSGNSFRLALHPEKIRSTLWTNFKRHGNGYQFQGRGWGHGVGLCQWGAKGQAEQGKDYREILSFYYPTAELKKWSR
ncbi:MAG: hypothetical protein KCHDKBKB_00137 [Elusimicrobia bacterium]|nr:hypothetical protein [Elusimicrobiota bacterium]